jgi:uncharacterized protein with HEPN domain
LDIIEAAEEVAAILSEGEDAFKTNLVSQRAIERLLEIIGEAANQISEETKNSFTDVEWRDVSNLRILLAHHYFRVDIEQMWMIASTDVPNLAAQLRQ